MKIYAKTQHKDGREEYYNRLPKPTQVKILGDYLRKNLSGVYDVKQPPNEYIIYDTILYSIGEDVRKEIEDHIQKLKDLYAPYEIPKDVREEIDRSEKKLQEIKDNIYDVDVYFNITTYGQYIRVNIILLDEYEVTLGYRRFEPSELISLPACKDKLMNYTYKQIENYFKKYEVLV